MELLGRDFKQLSPIYSKGKNKIEIFQQEIETIKQN